MDLVLPVDKDAFVRLMSATVLSTVGLVVSSLWFRAIVSNLAMSQSLRHSFRLTRKSLAAAIGCGMFVFILLAGMKKSEDIRSKGALFLWHPLSMVAATAAIFPAAFDAVTLRFGAKAATERKRLVLCHAVLQTLGLATLLMGYAAIYMNKPADKHLLTLHSWVGMAAIVASVLSWLIGVTNSMRFMAWPQLLWVGGVHRAVGTAAFALLALASASGLYNKVVLLPRGWGEGVAPPAASWLASGGTWSYGTLGHGGVYACLAALFWVAFFAVDSSAPSRGSTKAKKAE